jgi:hypothetical protein
MFHTQLVCGQQETHPQRKDLVLSGRSETLFPDDSGPTDLWMKIKIRNAINFVSFNAKW